LRKLSFCSQVVNIWNSLPDSVVHADTINTFESRIDKHWLDQDVVYNFNFELGPANECKGGHNYNGGCASAMRPFAKLLWTLVTASNLFFLLYCRFQLSFRQNPAQRWRGLEGTFTCDSNCEQMLASPPSFKVETHEPTMTMSTNVGRQCRART